MNTTAMKLILAEHEQLKFAEAHARDVISKALEQRSRERIADLEAEKERLRSHQRSA